MAQVVELIDCYHARLAGGNFLPDLEIGLRVEALQLGTLERLNGPWVVDLIITPGAS